MSVSNNTEIAGLNVSLRGRLVDLKKTVQRILEILFTIAVEDDGGASLDIAYFTQTRPREENNTGRPLLAITRDQLEHLRSLHFSWQKSPNCCMLAFPPFNVGVKNLYGRPKNKARPLSFLSLNMRRRCLGIIFHLYAKKTIASRPCYQMLFEFRAKMKALHLGICPLIQSMFNN